MTRFSMAKDTFIEIDDNYTAELEDKLSNIEEEKEETKSKKVRQSKDSKAIDIARERMEIMSKYNLRPATISTQAQLEIDEDLNLTIISKKKGLDKKDLAREYILQGLERDMKKIGIFENK